MTDVAQDLVQEELETLKTKLAAAEKLAEELAKQLEQRSVTSASRRVSVSSIKESDRTENEVLKREKEELKRENEELKSRLDIQSHLYDVGYKTRGRRLNEVKSKQKFGHNQALANSGNEVYRGTS